MRNACACARHNLRRLLTTPRAWAVLILTLLYVENQFAPIRLMLQVEQLTLGWPGMVAYFFSDAQVTAMVGLMGLMLLIDAPLTDETQRYIIARAGRGAWGRGQVLYTVAMSAVYVLIVALALLLFQLPWAEWSSGWSGGLEALVKDGLYEQYDTMLDYDPWVMDAYAPIWAMGLTLALHALAYASLALTQFAVNVRFGTRLGFLIASAPLFFDAVIEEFFGIGVFYGSPVTLSRLTTIDYGDGMGRPPVWYAFVVLAGLTAGLMFLCARLTKRREMLL